MNRGSANDGDGITGSCGKEKTALCFYEGAWRMVGSRRLGMNSPRMAGPLGTYN